MGLGADLHAWERQLPALTSGRRALVFDNRGIGRSDKPPGPYSTAQLADDLAALLDHVGWPRVHVIGISLGGMISQELALRHARRVKSLALIATYARSDSETRATAAEGSARAGVDLKMLVGAMQGSDVVIEPKTIMQFLMPMVFTKSFMEAEREYLKAMFERSLAYGFSTRGFAGQLSAALAHDTVARLATIGAPTLVVTGTRDKLIAPRHSRVLADGIPGSRFVEIEGGTHGLNLEKADRLNELLSGWLREHE
jgi:3-oxoadipate enol-lactonase